MRALRAWNLGPETPAPSDPGVQASSGWSGFTQDTGDSNPRASPRKVLKFCEGQGPYG